MNCQYCNKPIENQKRSTKKYCNDTCKQYAYIRRRYMQPTLGQAEKESNEQLTEEDPSRETNSEIITVKGEPQENNRNASPPYFREQVKYKKIRPEIIAQLDKYDFSAYKKYFTLKGELRTENFPYIRYIIPRIRCIVENILSLSHRRKVHYKTISLLHRALAKTIGSPQYRAMLKYGNFPFANDLPRLCLQLQKLSQSLRHDMEGIKLMIDKASLFRYIIIVKVIREFYHRHYTFRELFPELYAPQAAETQAA